MVGGSFALSTFTQTRYDLQEKKVSQMSKEEELHMSKNRRHVDIREEYFRLQAQDDDDWEPVRVPR
ncbi:cytochrome c oxidase assembly protein COX16, partial [Rhizoctonia solani]